MPVNWRWRSRSMCLMSKSTVSRKGSSRAKTGEGACPQVSMAVLTPACLARRSSASQNSGCTVGSPPVSVIPPPWP